MTRKEFHHKLKYTRSLKESLDLTDRYLVSQGFYDIDYQPLHCEQRHRNRENPDIDIVHTTSTKKSINY